MFYLQLWEVSQPWWSGQGWALGHCPPVGSVPGTNRKRYTPNTQQFQAAFPSNSERKMMWSSLYGALPGASLVRQLPPDLLSCKECNRNACSTATKLPNRAWSTNYHFCVLPLMLYCLCLTLYHSPKPLLCYRRAHAPVFSTTASVEPPTSWRAEGPPLHSEQEQWSCNIHLFNQGHRHGAAETKATGASL